jgi:hypothetical protein
MRRLISPASSTNSARPPCSRAIQARYQGSTGMQWPPMPGPGVKRMNPKGLVAAASSTSHTSRPMRSSSTLSSFTSAMLTALNTFSKSLAASATSTLDTRCTRAMACAYNARASSPESAQVPPTSLSISRVLSAPGAGFSRSGE